MISISNAISIAGLPSSLLSGGAPSNPDFVFTVDTTQAGSAADTIVLPLLSGGTYSGTIDWGDTSTSVLSYANRSHTYAAGGTYTITISGDTLQGWQFANSGDKLKITDIQNWGFFTITTDRTFDYCQNLDITATDVPIITTSSFYSIFRNCDALTTPDFSGWDTSSVTNMQEAFSGSALFNGNVANWVTASTTNIKQMLANCPLFNTSLSTWVTSGLTNVEQALQNCDSFDSSVANWELNGTWFRPFDNCDVFTGIGVETWDTSGLISGANMFVNCVVFNGDISGWNTSSLTNISNMLFNCDAFDQDLSSWDIDQISIMNGFMQNALGLSTSNYDALLVGWEATLQAAYPSGAGYPHTINVNFGGSQYGCEGLIAKNSLVNTFGWTITDGGQDASVNCNFVSTWDTTQAGSASDTVVLPLLSGGTYSGTIDWGDSTTSPLSYANRSHTYASSGTYTITISGTIEGWQFNNGGDKMKITDISNHGNLTITTNAAFYGCQNMDISATDAPIIATTTIQNMYASTVGLLTGGSGLYKMNTSSVTNFNNSFAGSGFNQSLNGLDVSNCGIQGIVNMFREAPNFANGGQPFDWSIASNIWMDDFVRGTKYNGTLDFGQGVVRLLRTLYNADSFDTSLAGLNIAPMTNASSFMQAATGMSTANYDATLIDWEAQLQAAYPSGAGYPYSINIHFGGSQFTSGGAGETAKNSLVSNFGWTITDGGGI